MNLSSPFGMLDFLPWDHPWNEHHYSPEVLKQSIQLMKEAGVGIVRIDFLWDDIERARGRFEFSKYDDIVNRLKNSGMDVLGILNYTPKWAAAHWNEAPPLDLYTLYARAVVRHFKNRVNHWEIWNEPDHETYWQPQDGMKAYVTLLKTVYAALKQEDPKCQILLGGLAKSISASLKNIYELGGKDFFDILNLHPFMNPLFPDAVGSLRYLYDKTLEIVKAFGDEGKPIWFTEVGCPGIPRDLAANDPRKTWWLGNSPNEIHQAGWVELVYTKVLKWPGVEKIFWAFFRDTPNHFKDGVDCFGLVRRDLSKKPAYEAFRKVACGRREP